MPIPQALRKFPISQLVSNVPPIPGFPGSRQRVDINTLQPIGPVFQSTPPNVQRSEVDTRTAEVLPAPFAPYPISQSLRNMTIDQLVSPVPKIPDFPGTRQRVDIKTLEPIGPPFQSQPLMPQSPWIPDPTPQPLSARPIGDLVSNVPQIPGFPGTRQRVDIQTLQPIGQPFKTTTPVNDSPSSIGQETVTDGGQLQGTPWMPIQGDRALLVPDLLGHVITDPAVLNADNYTERGISPPVPEVRWISDILRVGSGNTGPPAPAPAPAPGYIPMPLSERSEEELVSSVPQIPGFPGTRQRVDINTLKPIGLPF